jgi:hypothetical protein
MNRLQSLSGVNNIEEMKDYATKVLTFFIQNDGETREALLESKPPISLLYKNHVAISPMTVDEAKAIIQAFLSDTQPDSVPVTLIKALRSLLIWQQDETLSSQLEDLLSTQVKTLHFTPVHNPSASTSLSDEDKKKYKQRIERLKILTEENKYRQITSNLDKKIEDDATMKSMMYATSIGLNMIVAPLSFGAFMYFFSGALLDRFFRSSRQYDTRIGGNTGPDIRRVIAGVISGVVMLFIEMILFVIRNHEMDSSLRKKARSRKENPFGYSKSKAKKTFM